MSEVTSLRAATGDGFDHRDVILDANGVWYQRSAYARVWYRFGVDDFFHADNIPQPWTLVARAGEVVSLKTAPDAQIAVVEENGELREAHRRIANHEKATAEEFAAAGWKRQPAGEHQPAAVISATVLIRTDPVRGGE